MAFKDKLPPVAEEEPLLARNFPTSDRNFFSLSLILLSTFASSHRFSSRSSGFFFVLFTSNSGKARKRGVAKLCVKGKALKDYCGREKTRYEVGEKVIYDQAINLVF